jgi:predicted amidophosphoribosyltransferase
VLRAIRTPRPVLLVPVPATAAAARRRHGDHIARLARRAARGLRAHGVPATVVGALRARPRADSAELSAVDRWEAAESAFTVHTGRLPAILASGALVGLVDDIVTTGATLGAAGSRLAEAGVPVAFAAVLAATPKRSAILHRT